MLSKEEFIRGIASGDTRILSKAITLAESSLPQHRDLAIELIEHFGPHPKSFRIGITGTPGAGKSTFIEAAGKELLQDPQKKLAVLSIDPSSEVSGGSILGDKTRMSGLSALPNAYIRPTASGNQLGGLSRNTRLAMLLCEAAGFTHILIESVGVGQAETEIKELTDLFVLLLNPGGGDELQGIKRGIMEVADLLIVNKADGKLEQQAKLTAKEYSMALHLKPTTESGWVPKVLTTSAIHNTRIDVFWKVASEFNELVTSNGFKSKKRYNQQAYWVKKNMEMLLLERIQNYNSHIQAGIKKRMLPEKIAQEIVNKIHF
jgi:LAO/AO transport system kinase